MLSLLGFLGKIKCRNSDVMTELMKVTGTQTTIKYFVLTTGEHTFYSTQHETTTTRDLTWSHKSYTDAFKKNKNHTNYVLRTYWN